MAVPVYNVESAPKTLRGQLVSLNQLLFHSWYYGNCHYRSVVTLT